MFKRIVLLSLSAVLFSSCVSKKIYTELEDRYANLKKENRNLSDEVQSLSRKNLNWLMIWQQLQFAYDKVVEERDKLRADAAASKSNLDNLKASYDALEQNSSAVIAKKTHKKTESFWHSSKLKNQALAAESERLNNLKKELDKRSQRVAELESVIAAKDAEMRALKDAISKALVNFEGKGLTVEQRKR